MILDPNGMLYLRTDTNLEIMGYESQEIPTSNSCTCSIDIQRVLVSFILEMSTFTGLAKISTTASPICWYAYHRGAPQSRVHPLDVDTRRPGCEILTLIDRKRRAYWDCRKKHAELGSSSNFPSVGPPIHTYFLRHVYTFKHT